MASNSTVAGRAWARISRAQLLAAGSVLGALALRGYQIGEQELWYDEAFSFHMATLDDALEYIAYDYNPPLYYLLLRAWTRLAGSSEAALRMLSACFGTAFVAATIWAARQIFNWRVALWSGLVAAIAPIHIYYSQEARGYTLLLLLLVVVYALLWKALASGGRRHWIGASLAAAAALYTHYFAIFALLAAPALVVAAARPGMPDETKRWRRLAFAALAVVLLCLPWLVFRSLQPAALARAPDYAWRQEIWKATPPEWALLRSLEVFALGGDSDLPLIFLKQFTGLDYPDGLRLLGIIGLVLLGGLAAFPWGEKGLIVPGLARTKLAVVSLLMIPLVLMWLISFCRPIYLPARYDLVAFPAFVLFLGLGLAKVRIRRSLAFAAALAAMIVFLTAVATKLALYYRAPAAGTALATASAIDALAGDGDAVVFTHSRGVTVLYYLDRLGYRRSGGVCSSQARGKSFACRMFPVDTERTLVFEPERAQSAPERLREQARTLVQSIPAGRSLWVAFGGGEQGGGVFRPSPVDAPLAEELVKSGFSASPATEAPLLFRFRRASSPW